MTKGKRKCSICSTFGHNARTCPSKDKPIEEVIGVEPTSTLSVSKDKELGRKILAEKNKTVEREEIDGVVPTAGFWIVHHNKKKIAGKISKVKRTGEIIWRSALGAVITTPQEKFKEEGYSYIKDLEPEMLNWTII